MDPSFADVLLIAGYILLAGSLFSLAIGLIRRPERSKYREQWKKIAILAALALPMLFLGSLGRWGIAPLALALAYFGWREWLGNVSKNVAPFPLAGLATLLGCLGLAGALGDSPFTLFGAPLLTAWLAWVLPVLILRRPYPVHATMAIAFGMLFITLPLALMVYLAHNAYPSFAFLVIIALSNDGFAEGFGRLAGRTPLIPEVSPGKTREGFIGGIGTAMILGYFSRGLMPDWPAWQLMLISVGIGITGVMGDLVASSIKRAMGIKDFARLIPLIGGTLDKFDSLYYVAPLYTLIILAC